MTVSIFDTLAALPSGAVSQSLDAAELSTYLKAQVDTDEEKARNARHLLRDQMYRDGGVAYMKGVIGRVFQDPDVIAKRQAWVEFARFNNPIKRIVNELSTVYAEPAKRTVAGDQAAYTSLLDTVRMDEVMFQVGRLVNLHRSLLVGFRVRERASGELVPTIDIATPAHVRAVLHPNDSSEVVGWLVATDYRPARNSLDVPAWTLWSDHERVHLRKDMTVITSSYVEHGLGVCPWVPVTLGPPGAGFWPGEEGSDLDAAHVAIWLTNVLLLKEAKSATKVPVLQGDTTNMARGQAADTDVPIEVGDGTAISTVDMSMDLDAFIGVGNHVMGTTSNNYGMPAALVNHQGVQSAEARELMRIPLRELRLQQQVPLRRFEERFARVMAAVLAKDAPALAFSADGWRIEFGEAQTPLSGNQEMDLFLKQRTAGVTDTIEFIKARRPGITDDDAKAEQDLHILRETERVIAMRTLQAASGAMGSDAPSANEPVILGGDNAAADNGQADNGHTETP